MDVNDALLAQINTLNDIIEKQNKTIEKLRAALEKYEGLVEIDAEKDYKDRLFRYIFGNEKFKKWTLSLYNAVNRTNYTDPDALVFNTIGDVIYMRMKNDVSFIISFRMNIWEHQSSFNPNMPMRIFIYAGRLYEKYIATSDYYQYSSRLQPVPLPVCICFYNGTADQPEKQVLRLSDAYALSASSVSPASPSSPSSPASPASPASSASQASPASPASPTSQADFVTNVDGAGDTAGGAGAGADDAGGAAGAGETECGDIEVRVTMLNINKGKNKAIMDACEPLKEYAWFVDAVRVNQKSMELDPAVDTALDAMPDEFVIRSFLIENRAEVKNMILTEYNENKILAQERQEGRQEGIQEGQMNAFTAVAERLIDNGTDGPTISIATGFDRLRIDDIAKKLQRTVSWGTDTRTAQTIQTAQA